MAEKILRVRLDKHTAPALEAICSEHIPPLTRSAMVRELIGRAFAAADRERAQRAREASLREGREIRTKVARERAERAERGREASRLAREQWAANQSLLE